MRVIFRIALIASLSLAYLSSNAQGLIVKGGLTMSNMTIKDDNTTYSDDNKTRTGFHVGIAAELPLFAGIYFEPGVMFATRGYKIDLAEASYNLNYINVPLNLKYKLGIGEFSVFGSAGAYLGVGLNGKAKATILGKESEVDIEFGDKKDLKMLDYGLALGAGIEYHNVIVGVYYDLGLANLSNIDFANHKENNTALNITLGYRLGGN